MQGRRFILRPGKQAIEQGIRSATPDEIRKAMTGGRIESIQEATPQQIKRALEGTSEERLAGEVKPSRKKSKRESGIRWWLEKKT